MFDEMFDVLQIVDRLLTTFVPGTLQTAAGRYVRRVGRPRKEWFTAVLPEAFRRLHGNAERRM